MLSQYKILCVDDETANLRLLERLFRDSYEVLTAASGAEALEMLQVHDLALIISDQRMPGMTGIDFLKRAAEMRRQTVRIMLTGYTDAGTLVETINSGIVYKYVTKPWINEDLLATVKRALQHYETMKGQRQLQLQNERLQSRLKTTCDAYVDMLVEMLDVKDPLARTHAERTRAFAAAIGESLHMDRPEIERLSLAALLHEVPLIGVPAAILHKHSGWSAHDLQQIRQRFDSGMEMLERVPELEDIAGTLRFQFEHYDGSGRPRGFSREQIPVHARIIAIADAFDTMTDPRGNTAILTRDDAFRLLQSRAGTQFDPQIVNAFRTTQTAKFEYRSDLELVPA